MDGITILKKILEIDKEAIVVMHAALGQQAQADKCIKRGAKGVVFKPYPSKRLLEALKNALSWHFLYAYMPIGSSTLLLRGNPMADS